MMAFLKLSFVFLIYSFSAWSHVGHDHGPEVKAPPKGGVVQETKNYHVELVHRNNQLMVYFYDVKMKPVEKVKNIKTKAFTQLPRKDKVELELKAMGDHYHGVFDKKEAHRFTLYLEVEDEKKTMLKWTIH
jgi:hypothetical protein